MKMVRGAILSMCATVRCPSTKQLKYSNCTFNLGQTWIFYKVDETCLIQTKRDPGDPDDPTQFQPWYVHSYVQMYILKNFT